MPPAVEGAGQDGPEQRAHLGAGDEVGPAPTGAAALLVEAAVGVVQGQLGDLVEAHRPVPPGQVGDQIRDRHIGNWQVYGTSDASSPKRARSCG